jgi:hypothetical protein
MDKIYHYQDGRRLDFQEDLACAPRARQERSRGYRFRRTAAFCSRRDTTPTFS